MNMAIVSGDRDYGAVSELGSVPYIISIPVSFCYHSSAREAMASASESRKPHIALFRLCSGMGHLIPMAELAKRLCIHHGFSITFITSDWGCTARETAFIQSLATCGLDIRITELPHVDLDQQDQNVKGENRFIMFIEKAKPHIGAVLKSLLNSKSPVTAFVTDLFCAVMLNVSSELHIPAYMFFANSASVVCFFLYLPKLASEIQISFKDADFEVEVPGLPPIPPKDIPSPLLDRSNDAFASFVLISSRLREAAGILVNSVEEFEEAPIRAIREGRVVDSATTPSIYPIGPIISSDPDQQDNSGCLKWLDQQSPASVIFVSFGSVGVLSTAQIAELAAGLESSGHRFLWVVRGSSPETDLSDLLPEGFGNRTQDRGLVVPNWAPQIPVLSHPSIGGFVSHCGWNSTLESLTHGVPMICWPFRSEQRMNRLQLVNEMKVGVEVQMESDGFVKREEVERVVRELMEGEGGRIAREKAREMREKARVAVAEGGTSFNALAAAAAHFVRKPANQIQS